jgi:hypothetical protein
VVPQVSSSRWPWILAAGVGVIAAWIVLSDGDAEHDLSTRATAASTRVNAEVRDAKPGLDVKPTRADPIPADRGGAIVPDAPVREPSDVEAPQEPSAAGDAARPVDPRTAPAGTPPDIAATFARLPVSPADLPPVGGVGASGVHIDRIEMGASYDKGLCGGASDDFAVSRTDLVNVCIRVVHPRTEEMLSIVWQKKDGSTSRRGKIAVKPLHAYRTRAYLMVRKEYVGDWTVRILSADGVELASHDFAIAP